MLYVLYVVELLSVGLCRVRLLRKSFQGFLGRPLFRFLLALSYAAAGKLSLDPYFHLELFLMIRACLGNDCGIPEAV